MKKILLIVLLFVLTNSVKSQSPYQKIQDAINEVGVITGSDVTMSYFHSIPQTKINGTTDIVTAGAKGLFLLRVRATDFRGVIDFYLEDAPILQLTSDRSIDTGEIYVVCTSYDAMGIADESGTVTIEGYKYTPNSTLSKDLK